jgi:isocitrate dehydrogenase (NAD+)
MEEDTLEQKVSVAAEKFTNLIEMQLKRVQQMKDQKDFVDYAKLDSIIVGVCGGDGIGPIITAEARRVLEYLLKDDVSKGKIVFKIIEGLTIENRVACGKPIPEGVLAELKACHVILKGPTTTPQAGDPWPNIESANVAMARSSTCLPTCGRLRFRSRNRLDLLPREYRGRLRGGSHGVNVDEDLAFDFTVTTKEGTDRIARLAYDFAAKNGKDRVSIVTKPTSSNHRR